jgi:hypothetical protein
MSDDLLKGEKSTETAPAKPFAERLPWIPPTFETVKLDDAQLPQAPGGTHSDGSSLS